MQKTNATALVLSVLLGSVIHGFGQTNIQIISIVSTAEHATQLTWTSISNEVYEIDEADVLGTNADGSTKWNVLYTQYPSQGTNTFWLDTGNYLQAPPIVHPKYSPMRFYRIVDSGPDNTTDEPAVSILTPTNGFTASGSVTITVSASTDQPYLGGTTLYVDGQEMPPAQTSTNYVDGSTNYEEDTYTINTCEWLNGSHTLFATTVCDSGLHGPSGNYPVAEGHAVSAFVPVIFNNLVTGISFSQQFFNPAAGQTQQVTAIFPLNVNWTLQIVDIATNVVKTATGSGVSMMYNWDGTGTNGATVVAGVYHYLISAQTNGLPLPSLSRGTNSGGGSPPGPDFVGASGGGGISARSRTIEIPLPPLPPGMPPLRDAQGNEITNTFISMELAPNSSVSSNRSPAGGASPNDSPSGSGVSPATNQNADATPVRPPTAPVAGISVTYGVAYDTYAGSANGTNGYLLALPLNGEGFPPIKLDGSSLTMADYVPNPYHKTEVNNFVWGMQAHDWSPAFVLADNQFTIGQLRGSGNIFNSVSLGILLTHGSYGSGAYPDYTANGCFQMYFPITSGQSAQFLRMSEMNFGGAGTNGLKWIVLFACDSLNQANWRSMQSQNVKPYNSNLHLILGAASAFPLTGREGILGRWGDMIQGNNGAPPVSLHAAWFAAARAGYASTKLDYGSNPIVFAVAGDAACSGDFLQTNSTPTGTPFYDSNQVWP